jgi:hypothetical protein
MRDIFGGLGLYHSDVFGEVGLTHGDVFGRLNHGGSGPPSP